MAQQLADERALLRSEIDLSRQSSAELRQQVKQAHARLDALASAVEAAHSAQEDRIADLEHRLRIWEVMEYVRGAQVPEKMLVSVVMATRDRCDFYLPRAIDSVVDQSYQQWELLIVDDGSEDETPETVGRLDDERIRSFRIEHAGLAAARNVALASARGDLVTYLDDDNVLHPDWLRSVAWAFTEVPDVDVLYGAMIIDDAVRAERLGSGGLPWLNFIRYAPERLAAGNIADIGAVAHRAGLTEAIFDEALPLFEDWDLLARLTRDKEPLALPVLSGVYTTTAPDRLMARSQAEVDAATRELRSRLAPRPE